MGTKPTIEDIEKTQTDEYIIEDVQEQNMIEITSSENMEEP